METIGIIAMKCPNCGGRLEVSQDMTTFNCGYCGSSIVAQRRGGTVTLAIEEATLAIQKNTDRTAAELALRRLPPELELKQKELAEKTDNLQVWKYKMRDAAEIGTWKLKPIRNMPQVLLLAEGGVVGLYVIASISSGTFVPSVPMVVLLVITPLIGFSLVQSMNKKNSIENEKSLAQRKVAIQANIMATQRHLDEAQREFDEVSQQVEALTERIARNKAIADS